MGTYLTGTGQELVNVHSRGACRRNHCVIHNPSNHLMREWPTHWISSDVPNWKGMARVCPHELFHPDPDNLVMINHECDGCCTGHYRGGRIE